VLHLPPWMSSWMCSEAERCGIDAAVMLMPPDNRLSQSGTQLTAMALRDVGVPVLQLEADMVDAKNWSHERMVQLVENFLGENGLA
jgi:benzoyl-CoA reductase subunit B